MKYRPDIDGLRAVAVLVILFYHAKFSGFSGGFIGVDVFFVISGFLITKKISTEIQARQFSLVTFYESRIRRIFPALFTVIFVVLIVGAWLYTPESYLELSRSSTATTLFFSNIFFWKQSGYFETPSTLKPLLHMWSLSVEEQFYIGLPLFILLIYRFRKKKPVLILGLVAVVSFAICLFILSRDASAAFFLAHLRAWELLMGGMIALTTFKLPLRYNNLASGVGLSIILAGVFLFSKQTPFPGWAALVPTLGSALIIFSGINGTSLVGKILSLKPMIFIGKISYSLYLWHWPIMVFGRYYLIRKNTTWEVLLWIAISFLLAFLSWKFIETPFRSKEYLVKPRIFILAGSVMVLTLAANYAITSKDGFPQRFKSVLAATTDDPDWNREWGLWEACDWNGKDQDNIDPCLIGAPDQSPIFLLWGDSHVHALASAVNLSSADADVAGYVIKKIGCPPLLGIDQDNKSKVTCTQFNQAVLEFIRIHPEIKSVVINARWAIYTEGSRYKSEEGNRVYLVDRYVTPNEKGGNTKLFKRGFTRTLEQLIKMDRQVIIVASVPEVGYDVPSTYWIATRTRRDLNQIVAPSWVEYQARNKKVLSTLDELKETYPEINIIDPTDILCKNGICNVINGSTLLYRDDDHLSTAGAYMIAPLFDPSFKAMSR